MNILETEGPPFSEGGQSRLRTYTGGFIFGVLLETHQDAYRSWEAFSVLGWPPHFKMWASGQRVRRPNHAKEISKQGKHPFSALNSNCTPDFPCSGLYMQGYKARLESKAPMIKSCFLTVSRTQRLLPQQYIGAVCLRTSAEGRHLSLFMSWCYGSWSRV